MTLHNRAYPRLEEGWSGCLGDARDAGMLGKGGGSDSGSGGGAAAKFRQRKRRRRQSLCAWQASQDGHFQKGPTTTTTESPGQEDIFSTIRWGQLLGEVWAAGREMLFLVGTQGRLTCSQPHLSCISQGYTCTCAQVQVRGGEVWVPLPFPRFSFILGISSLQGIPGAHCKEGWTEGRMDR